MRIRAIDILFTASLVLLSCSKHKDGEISGIVKEPTLFRPLPGVVACIQELSLSTVTDSGGHFRFPEVPPGGYHLQLSRSPERYDFPSPEVKVTVDSVLRLTVMAIAQGNEIYTQPGSPRVLFVVNPGCQILWGNYFGDPQTIPLWPFRIVLKDSTERFISSLNDFRGHVMILSQAQAIDFAELLSRENILFEYNELGGRFYDACVRQSPFHSCGFDANEWKRLGLREPSVRDETDSTYVVDRYLVSSRREVVHTLERVSRTGRYELLLKDSVGLASHLPICEEL